MTPRPLRVTVVLPHPVVGGAELWLMGLLEHARGLDVDVDVDVVVLASDSVLHGLLVDRGLRVRSLPTGRHGWSVLWSGVQLAQLLRRERPDVLLCNGVKAAAVGVPAARLAGVRAVFCKHDYVFDQHLGRVLARLADEVVAPSTALLEHVRPVRASVVLPPAPREPASPAESAAFWRAHGVLLGDRPSLAMVCRIVEYKAIDVAIRALSYPAGHGWQLVVVGGPDFSDRCLPDRLRMLADTIGVGDRVVFTGPVPEAGRQLSAMDAVAVLTVDRPTTSYTREGFGMAAMEALLAGVPLIATPAIPAAALAPEAVLDVPPEDPAAVAGALAQVARLQPVAEGAGRRLRSEYPSTSDLARRLVSVLAAVACRPGAGQPDGPPLSVVTTVLNEADGIGVLCGQMLAQLGPDDELVVVDAGSTDGTLHTLHALASTAPALRVEVRPGASISAGRNAGAAVARHDVLAFTDAGCVVLSGWVDGLRAAFAVPEPPALVTGIYRVSARTPWERAFVASSYPSAEETLHPGLVARPYGRVFGRAFDAVLCTGRSMAVTREAWAGVGGFPEHLHTAEDVLFGRAVARAGGRCVLDVDAEVVWSQRSSLRSTAKMYYGYGRGGGHSRDRLLVGRDLARAVAYAFGVWTLSTRRPGPIALSAVGAAAYLILPVQRGLQGPVPAQTLPLIPLTLAVKDLAKAAGCLVGLLERPTR